jgi:hypothetical protein
VTNRGNRREALYRTDTDQRRFLGLVAELPERYVAVRHGGQRLAEVVRVIGGVKYGAAAQAVRQFAAGLAQDAAKVRFCGGDEAELARANPQKTAVTATDDLSVCK